MNEILDKPKVKKLFGVVDKSTGEISASFSTQARGVDKLLQPTEPQATSSSGTVAQ